MRLCDSPDGSDKHKLTFDRWKPEHKYILKANMDDPTLCRNLVTSRIWAKMVESRANVDPRLAAMPTHGAVDGFPATLWLNGEFQGLYTMNIHKDNDLYGMKYGDTAAVMIANRQTKPESLFREESVFDKENFDWEIEYCSTDYYDWVRSSFNSLIRFVMDSNDEEFRTHVGDYLDVDAAIDYLIFIQALGLKDNSAKDLVLITYDEKKWIPTVYDMDDAFTDPCIPIQVGDEWVTGTNSLLWDRVLKLFRSEIEQRYHELRADVLSTMNLVNQVTEYVDSIPPEYYEQDLARYPGRDADETEQIIQFILSNMPQLDEVYGGFEQ